MATRDAGRCAQWAWLAVMLVVLGCLGDLGGPDAVSARRTDADFEFDEPAITSGGGSGDRRLDSSVRYVYDPHSPLCKSLVCGRRESCLLRDGYDPFCGNKRDLVRNGGRVVAAAAKPDDEDVFFEGASESATGCGGCPASGAGEFLCGSDNRTYSSPCRLRLHNCVRRTLRPGTTRGRVRARCAGFCPCPANMRNDPIIADGPYLQPRRNEVIPPPADGTRRAAHGKHRRPYRGGIKCELDKMADRLLDWFSVLMEQAGARAPLPDGFPRDCKPEVRWMFEHLDTDGDGLLSAHNLYALRHDPREQCLRPFVTSCGAGGSAGLSRASWCSCLHRAARPCAALSRRTVAPGQYVPACDARGFYRPRQCHPALGVCWCVSPHGVEVPHSRTKGAPPCPESAEDAEETDADGAADPAAEASAEADAAGAPDDDEDAADDADVGSGQGDNELRF